MPERNRRYREGERADAINPPVKGDSSSCSEWDAEDRVRFEPTPCVLSTRGPLELRRPERRYLYGRFERPK